MESQKELVAQFRKEKKQKATRLKRKTEEMIKEASTASRRASSRLRSANRESNPSKRRWTICRQC